jgi:hypothetical protein
VLRRVVQECLTNIAKHAPSTSAEATVTYQEDSVSVRVRNEPVGSQSYGDGRGLAGLRERVRLLGGSLQHGPRDGGFEVVARMPYTAPPVPVETAAPVRQARRRFRRDLVVAAGLPVAALVLLAGGLKGWSVYLTAQSVLPASAFAGLRVGQDRASVERVLPDREAPERPPGSAACSYYAMTADPMDDRSGDLYRLCWRSGVLASLSVVRS